MLRAHIALVRAEMAEIGAEIARAAGLVLAAAGCLGFMALFLLVGGLLFLGEWIFGSIGWGLLLGCELFLVAAVSAVLAAVRAGGTGRAAITAGITALVAAVVFGASLTNLVWITVGAAILPGVESGVRPLVVGTLFLAIIGLVVGAAVGAKFGRVIGAAIGLAVGLVAGALLGAFTAVAFGPRVGIALALATAIPVFAGTWAFLGRTRLDPEELKKRFVPQATIDTFKETIEWAKARNPLAPKS